MRCRLVRLILPYVYTHSHAMRFGGAHKTLKFTQTHAISFKLAIYNDLS